MKPPPWRCEKHDVESVEIGRRGKGTVRVCPVCRSKDARRLRIVREMQKNGKRMSA